MSTIVSTSSLTTSTASTTSTTDSYNSLSQLGADDFLKLLLAELENQDPTDPVDTSEMISEFSTLSQVAQGEETNGYLETISQYITSMNNSQAVSYIGKTISYADDEISVSNGTAGSVSYTLASDASCIHVTIYDADGNTVNTIDLGSISAGTYSYSWDCTDTNGVIMEDGEYSFKFSASDQNSETISVYSSTEKTAAVTGIVYRDGVAYLVTDQGEIAMGVVTGVS